MFIQFESYDSEELTTIFRDLSQNENLDVKKLFNEYLKDEKQKNKKHLTKADKIIMENKENKIKKEEIRDNERLVYYKDLTTLSPNILDELSVFKTKAGKNSMKMKILNLAYKKDDKPLITNLYLQLLSESYKSKSDERLMNKITPMMHKIDYKTMQFEKLSNELSPLDFYNDYEKKLDGWQIKTLKNIDRGISTLVCAPTSCGKTWLSIYPGVIGKRVLFIVPTVALVYQVSSLFVKFGAEVFVVCPDFTYGSPNNSVVVGTPKDIEDKLPAIGKTFDIVVFDEIHNLINFQFGGYYERLIKMLKDNTYLALSATIGNPEKLRKWFSDIKEEKMDLIVYTTRFLNLQRHLFSDNKLTKIHPMSCLTKKDINKEFLMKNLPMTPYDCVSLYQTLGKYFGSEMDSVSVSSIFPEDNRRLSLDDARKYEEVLKKKLIEISNNSKIDDIITDYHLESNDGPKEVNLYNLFREIKSNNLTPCIVFQQNTIYCKEIFSSLVGYLEKLEQLNYPYHYDNLEFTQEEFLQGEKDLKRFKDNIKLPPEFMGNSQMAIEEKLKNKWIQITNDFETKYTKNYERQIALIKKSDVNDKIKKVQIRNLIKEHKNFTDNIVLKFTDVFQKHPEFCLNTSSPMTADQIRGIRRTIKSKLGIKVSYTNVFMQGLKRGIGIYTTDMPPVYNMIVQSLAQNGKLGFVIADVSLALGINMPFRSTCILGYKDSRVFELYNYLQMIGRSGRRGQDREGHIIYGNVDWKNLMKGELSEITSAYKNIDNYSVIEEINSEFNNYPDTYKNILDESARNSVKINKNHYSDSTKNILLWKLREYNDSTRFLIDNLLSIEMQYRMDVDFESISKLARFMGLLFISSITDKEKLYGDYENSFSRYTCAVLKKNRIIEEEYINFRLLKELISVIKNIHNVLISDERKYYKFICSHLKRLFNTYKFIIFNSNGLN